MSEREKDSSLVEVKKRNLQGLVVAMEDDHTTIKITDPNTGGKCKYYFDTRFLEQIGIERAGTRVGLTFSQGIDPEKRKAVVTLEIESLGLAETIEQTQAAIENMVADLDFDLIGKKFGCFSTSGVE